MTDDKLDAALAEAKARYFAQGGTITKLPTTAVPSEAVRSLVGYPKLSSGDGNYTVYGIAGGHS